MRNFASQISESQILRKLELEPKDYILVTAHRSENVDNPFYLESIFSAIGRLASRFDRKVIYPMHPRTRSKLGSIAVTSAVKLVDPLGFYDFNRLLKDAFCVLSDSGTAAEEGLFYKVPNVSLRMATERPETVESGGTIVSGMDIENIIESVATAVSQPWGAHYELEENSSPSSVVINAIRSQITNYF
jgi:UDP-N-acetylglucosamine 2-epimerase (non-hydrolysing)